jgi:hypothetical protein
MRGWMRGDLAEDFVQDPALDLLQPHLWRLDDARHCAAPRHRPVSVVAELLTRNRALQAADVGQPFELAVALPVEEIDDQLEQFVATFERSDAEHRRDALRQRGYPARPLPETGGAALGDQFRLPRRLQEGSRQLVGQLELVRRAHECTSSRRRAPTAPVARAPKCLRRMHGRARDVLL